MLLFLARLGRRAVDPRPLEGALATAAAPYVQLEQAPATVVSPSGCLVLTTLGHPSQDVRPRRPVARRGDVVCCVDGLAVEPEGRFPAWDAEALLDHWERTAELEGQFAALRADLARDRLECRKDALGLAPLYAQRLEDGWVVANSIAAIRGLTGASEPDRLGVAGFLTLGWAPGGRTLFEPVRALIGGRRTTFTAAGRTDAEEFTPAAAVARARTMPRGAEGNAAFLDEMVAMTRAALVGPGVPVKCAVTAGRDSRAMLALCLAAGARPQTATAGAEDHVDVVIGRRLAQRAGLDHERWPPEASGRFDDDPIAAVRRFTALTDGTCSLRQLQDVGDLDRPVAHVGLQAWGIGGEIGRAGIGPLTGFAAASPLAARSAALQARLLRAKARPLGGLPTAAAIAETSAYLDRFAAERLDEGWRPSELGEAFYTFEHIGRWATTGIRRASPTDDLFSPFASRPFVVYSFSLRAGERYAELPHRRLIGGLRPDLMDIEFEWPWRVAHPRVAGIHATAEMARLAWGRVAPRRRPAPGGGPGVDNTPWVFRWLARHREVLRDAVLSTPATALWEFADRGAVEAAFGEDPLADWDRAEALLRVAAVAFALDAGR